MTGARRESQIQAVLSRIEASLGMPAAADGSINRHAVEAIDVVNHALVYVESPRGLDLWREALWDRRLSDESRAAVVTMLHELMASVDRGDLEAVNRVCDCLHAFLPGAPGSGESPA